MTAYSNSRYNPRTDSTSFRTMDSEIHVISEFEELPGIYGIRLQDAPQQGSITISGYTEITTGAPTGTEFWVDYSYNTALIIFHSGQAGNSVTVDYNGGGTVFTKNLIVSLADNGGARVGRKNYIRQTRYDAESTPNGWTVSESTGAIIEVTTTNATGEVLEGDTSYKVSFSGYTAGDYAAVNISDIDLVDQAQTFDFRFAFMPGTAYDSGDLEVVIYDGVSEIPLTLDDSGDSTILATTDYKIDTYAMGTNFSNMQVRFKAVHSSGTGGNFEVFIDDLFFGPQEQVVSQIDTALQNTVYFSDVKSQGTAGGATSSSTDNVHVINTTSNPHSLTWFSLSSNQITISESGYYSFFFQMATYRNSYARARIYNTSSASVELSGLTCYDPSTSLGAPQPSVAGIINVTAGHVFEVRMYTTGSNAAGFGSAANITGQSEIYLKGWISKIS